MNGMQPSPSEHQVRAERRLSNPSIGGSILTFILFLGFLAFVFAPVHTALALGVLIILRSALKRFFSKPREITIPIRSNEQTIEIQYKPHGHN